MRLRTLPSSLLSLATLQVPLRAAYSASEAFSSDASYLCPAPLSSTDLEEKFDYVVVGSGPGGGPLAVNLAEAGYSVLLLEAGQNHTAKYSQEIPAFFGAAQWDEEQGWWFYVKHYSNESQAALDSKMVWRKPDSDDLWVGHNPPPGSSQLGLWYPRAGALGGCDTHNGGVTVLPSDWDWDNIAEVTADASWRHEEMRKLFERMERNLFLPEGTAGHGFAGYQPVGLGHKSYFEKDRQMVGIAQGSVSALGYADRGRSLDWDMLLRRDVNEMMPDRDQHSDAYQVSFKKDERGRRYSAANRISDAVARGLPLTVRLDSLVSRVLLDSQRRATGVEYLPGRSLYRADPRAAANSSAAGGDAETARKRTVTARREVIVAGGTFNTPQILMLSGIGPAAHLAEHGIQPRVDLPGVGANLQDHYEVPVIHQFGRNFSLFDGCDLRDGVFPCYEEWRVNGTGPFSTIGFSHLVLSTSSVAPRRERDLMLYGAPDAILGHLPPYANQSRLREPSDNRYFTLTISESHPRNRAGRVRLRSADARDRPEINFEYFAGDGADDDVQGLVDGIRLARRIFDAVPEAAGPVAELYPGRGLETTDQLRAFVRAEAYGHHPTGTAAMGRHDDVAAVVDSRFRVRGVDGLRVVDASVFPDVPGTFPLIAVFLISEKASDVILADAETRFTTMA